MDDNILILQEFYRCYYPLQMYKQFNSIEIGNNYSLSFFFGENVFLPQRRVQARYHGVQIISDDLDW